MRVFVYERDDGGRTHIDLDHVLAISIEKRVIRQNINMPKHGPVDIYEESATLALAFRDQPMALHFRYAEDREKKRFNQEGNEVQRSDRFQDLLKAWRGDL